MSLQNAKPNFKFTEIADSTFADISLLTTTLDNNDDVPIINISKVILKSTEIEVNVVLGNDVINNFQKYSLRVVAATHESVLNGFNVDRTDFPLDLLPVVKRNNTKHNFFYVSDFVNLKSNNKLDLKVGEFKETLVLYCILDNILDKHVYKIPLILNGQISNTVIFDYRFSSANVIAPTLIKENNLLITNNSHIVSKLYNSFDDSQNLKLLFSLDVSKFLSQKVKFPKILSLVDVNEFIYDLYLNEYKLVKPDMKIDGLYQSIKVHTQPIDLQIDNSNGTSSFVAIRNNFPRSMAARYKLNIYFLDKTIVKMKEIIKDIQTFKKSLVQSNNINTEQLKFIHSIIKLQFTGKYQDNFKFIENIINTGNADQIIYRNLISVIDDLLMNLNRGFDTINSSSNQVFQDGSSQEPYNFIQLEHFFTNIIELSNNIKVLDIDRERESLDSINVENLSKLIGKEIIINRNIITTNILNSLKPLSSIFSETVIADERRVSNYTTNLSNGACFNEQFFVERKVEEQKGSLMLSADTRQLGFEILSSYNVSNISNEPSITSTLWKNIDQELLSQLIKDRTFLVRIFDFEKVTNKYFLLKT